MKRCVISSRQPWNWIDQFKDYSIMVVNPDAPGDRLNYLLANSDYSLLVTDQDLQERSGGDYANEKVFWYTSGTTGDSKFYSFSQTQLATIAKTICHTYEISKNDRYYSVMPLWHAHGQGFYWAVKYSQCEHQFGSIKNIKEISAFQPTFLTAIPDIMQMVARCDLRHLRFLRTASAALPVAQYHELKERFAVPVLEAFGMTEACSHCFTNPLHGVQKPGTVGLPDNVEVRLKNNHLWIRGDCTVNQDWIDTGDLAEQDREGYVRILGRYRDQINVRGIKINPVSIENQLYNKFPRITQCAVFGQSNLKCLYVGDTDQNAIDKFLNSLGTHCRPILLAQVDHIPTNAAGKISRQLLQQLFV